MAFFKFTPDLTDKDDLEEISVGRDKLVHDCIERIKNSVHNESTRQILFLGPRGIGKSHTLLRIFYGLSNSDKVTIIRLAEEEYSISSLDDLCQRILEELDIPYDGKDATAYCRNKLSELKNNGKMAVLFVENLQLLFDQIYSDLGKLRSIIQSDQSLCIVGSALTHFDLISSPDEPFYKFFDIKYLQGLTEEQVFELIKKRLVLSKKEFLIKDLEEHLGRVGGIHLLTGGNPRLIHILAEIIVQKNSLEDLERNLLSLLDQLTPFYQARMETMSRDQRRIFDMIALSEGPLSPTEIAKRLNNSKPAIVVAQLRRLQKDGLVENVKFSNKRGTRYQIVERLYRIWRELRSTRGASKVKLFVDFMKLWYSKEELMDGLKSTSEEIDELYPHSKKEALSAAKKMCYLLNAVSDLAIISLTTVVEKLVLLNQFETARQEIQKVRDLNNREKNKILQKSVDLITDIVELDSFTYSTDERDDKRQSIMNKINKLSKQKVNIPKDENDRGKIHVIYEEIAFYLISSRQYERALYFNDIAYDCVKNIRFCNVVLNQRAAIKTFLKRYSESLTVIDEILEYDPEDLDALSRKVYNLTALKKQDSAVQTAKQLLALDVEYFVQASRPFIDFKLERELLALTKQYKKALLGLEPGKRSRLLRDYVGMLFHELLHMIIAKKTNERQFYVSILSSIKDMVKAEDLIHGCVGGISTHAKGINAIQETMPILLEIFGSDKLKGLTPLICASDYLADKDPTILEKLHPEMRQLVIQIIQKMSPDIPINKEILDSISV